MVFRTSMINRDRLRRRLNVDVLEERTTPTVSTITDSFNGASIAAYKTIWFSSVAKVSGLSSTSPVTLHVDNGTIDFTAGGTPYHLLVPNGVIVFTPGATSASATFDPDDNDWDVAVPSSGTGNVFLTGVQMPVLTNLPGGITNIKWSANFWADKTGVTASWSWAAAVYKIFNADYNAIGVKPVDNNNLSIYHNTDKAGTPEAFKGSVINGATGGGGTNYTGTFSSSTNVKAAFGDGVSDYPYPSSNPLTSVVFNESTVLKGANMDLTNGNFELWYSDEHALALGVGSVIVKTSTGSTTTTYPVTPLTSNPGSALNADVGSQITSGDQAGVDLSGRPMFPSLFITDITNNPNNRSGDWQWGGTALPPSAVFGTWKGVVRTVDKTTSTPTVTVTCNADPAKNNWNLGPGSDAPPTVLANEGYGAEARWSLASLQNAGILIPGHNYRFYVIVHDGDQNKSGGDCGQASWQYSFPGVVDDNSGTLSGRVYVELDGTDGFTAGDAPVPHTQVQLLDATGLLQSVLTGDDGTYSFTGLAAGTYTIREIGLDSNVYDPALYYHLGYAIGTLNGEVNNFSNNIVDSNDISLVSLNSGNAGVGYNFIEGFSSGPPG
jgi:hypothetical protein